MLASDATAAVVVVANRSAGEVRFIATPAQGKPQQYTVASSDLAVVPTTGPVEIAFDVGKERRRYQLDPDTAYYFGDHAKGLDLREIRIGAAGQGQPSRPSPLPDKASPAQPRVLTVKILVDQKELMARAAWEKRLRARLDAVSQTLERVCRVKLKVVATEEWQSNEALTDLRESLADFERKVKAHPAQLAIGFTSQSLREAEENRSGVTRAALHDRILIREWRPATESGRIDVLLHELGHYLGATHSPEPDSVMRPLLGDNPRVRANWRCSFDPVNALVMNLVADEIFDRGIRHLGKVAPSTRERLRQIYEDLAQTLPDDPTPDQYLNLLGRAND
ncbi:MAG: matrixin family metalloprotease [Gemmataceae bacterium]